MKISRSLSSYMAIDKSDLKADISVNPFTFRAEGKVYDSRKRV